MKILHAYLFFSIKFAGGTSDLMYKICKAQVKHNHKPLIYSGNYKFDKELAKSLTGTKFVVLSSWLDKLGFSIMPQLRSSLENNKENIEIVHMHVFRTFQNVVLYFFCKKNNIPYVIDAHGAVPYYSKKNFIKKLFDLIWGKRMLREADFLIAETEVGVKEYLDIDPRLDKEKIITISPPFDTDEFIELPNKGLFRNEIGIEREKKIIMFIGRVHHIKGIDFLIKGFADLCKRRQDCILIIVGSDDGHMEECKTISNQLGITNRVIFTGFLGGDKKNSALVDADIVVQVSRQEQGAWAPFEAVLCKTPIVVTDHTGAGEDVKRIDAGETVKFNNIQDLSTTIDSILDNYFEAKNKTLKAKEFIETKMSMNARAHEYIDLYERALINHKDA